MTAAHPPHHQINADDIAQVDVPPPNVSARAFDEQKLHCDHEFRSHQSKIGWIGKLLGDKEEKPGNISFMIIIFAFSMLIVLYYFPRAGVEYKDFFAFLTNAITLAMGYLFGRGSDSK